MKSSSVTACIVDLGNVVVPEGQCPSGDGEREDTVGNDASELGCEERVVGSVIWGTESVIWDMGRVARGSLFDASIYYI